MSLLPKLRLSPRLVRWAYRFVDLEASAEPASPDQRLIEYAFVIGKLHSRPPGRVLDVGCTSSLNCLPAVLASIGWEVRGIDFREFKYRHANFEFTLGDFRHTGFPDNSFDAVYAVSTLEHVGLSGRYGLIEEDPEGDIRTVEEMGRILRPGGSLLCTLPYAREARILRPLQRIYDQSSLDRLFSGWTLQDQAYFARGDSGYWSLLSENEATEVENPDGSAAVALLELSRVPSQDGEH